MFEFSKNICDKIYKSNCLTLNELSQVEQALRLTEINDQMLYEAIGTFEKKDNIFDLIYTNMKWKNKGE